MGELARQFDWATTPLGPVFAWPAELKSAAAFVLENRFPAALIARQGLVTIYNDAFKPILGSKPEALGKSFADIWAEAWDEIGPIAARALDGVSTFIEDYPLVVDRGMGLAQAYFTFSYSPVRAADGLVIGFIDTVVETTERIRGEQIQRESEARLANELEHRKNAEAVRRDMEERQAVLLKLSDALRPVADPREIMEMASRMLGEHLQVDGVMYGEVEQNLEEQTLIIRGQFARNVAPIPERISHDAFSGGFVAETYRKGLPLVVENTGTDARFDDGVRARWLELSIRSLIAVPMLKQGREPVIFGLHHSQPRSWSESEVTLVLEVAERTWAAAERARAEEVLRRTAENFYNLVKNAPFGVYMVDADFRIVEASRGAHRSWEGVLSSLVGVDLAGALHAIWPEPFASEVIGYYRQVLQTGEPYISHDTVARRGDKDAVEAYDWRLERITMPDGRFGVVCYFYDQTERQQLEDALRESQERQGFLLRLSDALRPLASAVEIQSIASRLLGEHLGLDRCGYCEIDDAKGLCTTHQDYHVADIASFAGIHRMDDYGSSVIATMRRGETLVVGDIDSDPVHGSPAVAQAYAASNVRALIGTPLVKDADFVAILFAQQRTPRQWTPSEVTLIEEVAQRTWAAVGRARAETALRESEERYRAILDSALDYAIFTTDAQGRIETWPPGAEAVFGWSAQEVIGQDMAITFVPEDRESGAPESERAQARQTGCAPNVRWHLRKDGRRVFLEGSLRPLTVGGPGLLGFLKVGQDKTQRHQWEETQKILVAELQHRTRNLIAVVRSIAAQTMVHTGPTEAFTNEFNHRLAALSRVQGLLSQTDQNAVTIGGLVKMELDALGAEADRCSLSGPLVYLPYNMVQTLALALHELATNARKHGALATAIGRLNISWSLRRTEAAKQMLSLEWLEEGLAIGSAAERPGRSGYGRELIERALPYSLGAQTSFMLGQTGLRCTIDLPLPNNQAGETP